MSYNPTLALNAINPSLVGYTGGIGKAMQAIGGSMSDVGKARLDLEKQAADQKYRDDMYKLSLNADTRAGEAVTRSEKDKFDTKNEKYAANATTNAFLMGQEAPVEMSNEYAKLSLIDPTITAAALKRERPEYTATDKGLIFNKHNPNDRYDLRTDEDKNSGFGAKGTTHVDTISKGGKVMRTFFLPDGTTKSITAEGTPSGIAGMTYGDALGDVNAYTRPQESFKAGKNNEASVVVDRGDLPVKIPQGTPYTKAMTDYTYIGPGGMRMVPKEHISAFKKQFPQLKR